jgi:hypothetical protein
MKKALTAFALLGLAAAAAPACNGGFPTIGEGKKLVVTLAPTDELGAPGSPLQVQTALPGSTFHVHVEAHMPDGTVDTSFNGYVNISSQPGTVTDLTVRNVQLKNGVIVPPDGGQYVSVPVIGAFGQAHIWAEDLGYEPVEFDPSNPPQCSDGKDNNGNGLIDYPADPGCYAPIDGTEDLGNYAAGVSPTLYFSEPRIELVRGFDPKNNGNGNSAGFPHQQISIDTGWRGDQNYDFSTIVVGLTSAGFYVEDLQNDQNPKHGYNGLYAYNFSTPAFMRVCDRVQILSGTSDDFYGFTELNYPTWQIEYWNPANGPCPVPDFQKLLIPDLNSNNRLWQVEATLVQVETGDRLPDGGLQTVHVAKHFGSGNVPRDDAHCLGTQTPPCYVPDAEHSNCDFDHSGKINFNDPLEAACAAACSGSCSAAPFDYECSEWSQYASQNDFELVVNDSANPMAQARIQANAAAANGINPVELRGQNIRSFVGLLAYFSGGCQFTMNARCADDVTVGTCPKGETDCAMPIGSPIPAQAACVHARTLSDINANSQ